MPSVLLRSEQNFLRLLLQTSREQGCLLLGTATSKQIGAICEIALNLLTQVLPKAIRSIVRRHKLLLEKLAKTKLAIQSKARLLKKHCKIILRILLSIRDLLLDLIG